LFDIIEFLRFFKIVYLTKICSILSLCWSPLKTELESFFIEKSTSLVNQITINERQKYTFSKEKMQLLTLFRRKVICNCKKPIKKATN